MATDPHKDLGGGIDGKSSRNSIPKGKSEVLENLKPHTSGKLETRKGVRSHAGVVSVESSEPITGTAIYRSQLEEYPLVTSNGKIYARTAGTAVTTVDIEADLTADFSIGPAFQQTNVDPTSVRRTRGAILGDNIFGNQVIITSAEFTGSGFFEFKATITNRSFLGAASLSDVVDFSGSNRDYITVSQIPYPEYNGTFKIILMSEVVTGSDSVLTITTSPAEGSDSSTPMALDCDGRGGISTDQITVAAIQTLEEGDTIVGIYDSAEGVVKTLNSEVSVREITGNVVTLNLVEDEYEDDDGTPGVLTIQGSRIATGDQPATEATLPGNFSIGNAFETTGYLGDIRRTSGIILGDNVTNNAVVVTAASYDSILSRATYTIAVDNRLFAGGASAITDVIKTTTGEADWITISGVEYPEYNGKFEVVSLSEVVTTGDSVITLVVSNTKGTANTPARTGIAATGKITTDVITVSDIGSIKAADEVGGIKSTTGNSLLSLSSTIRVRSINGTNVVLDLVDDEYLDSGVNTLQLDAIKPKYIIPVASTVGFNKEEMIDIDIINRPLRLEDLAGNRLLVDEELTITHGDVVTENYKWVKLDPPVATGDLIPETPVDILSNAPVDRVRTATMQDSVYLTNGRDNVQKYDGANVYRAGIINWDFAPIITVNSDSEGITLEEIPFTDAVADPTPAGIQATREISLTTAANLQEWSDITDARTKRKYQVINYDSTSGKVSLGALGGTVPAVSRSFLPTETTPASGMIAMEYHNLSSGTKVKLSTTGTLPTGWDSTTEYTVGVKSTYHITLLSSRDGTIAVGTGTGTGTHTLTTVDNLIYIPTKYSYYYKLTAIDANSNLVSSFVSGHSTSIVNVETPGQIVHTVTLPPAIQYMDYDRLELEVYRTKAGQVAPFYKLRSISVNFDTNYSTAVIVDATPDAALSNLDEVSTSIKGGELPTSTEAPPIAKYLTTTSNRLLLGNIKTNDIIDVDFTRISSGSEKTVNSLSSTVITVSDSTTGDSLAVDYIDLNSNLCLDPNNLVFTTTDVGGLLTMSVSAGLIVEGAPVTFKTTSGVLPSNIATTKRYFMKNINTVTNTFNLTETLGGTEIPYVDSGTDYFYAFIGRDDRLYTNSQKIEEVNVLYTSTEPTVSFTQDGADLVITTDLFYLEVGERIKFYAKGSTPVPDILLENTSYYVVEYVAFNKVKISLTKNGTPIAYTSTPSTSIVVEAEDSFYLTITSGSLSGITEGDLFTLNSFSFNSSLLGRMESPSAPLNASDLSTNTELSKTDVDILGRFMGTWKVGTVLNNSSIKVRFTHKVTSNPSAATYLHSGINLLSQYAYTIYLVTNKESNTVPLISTTSDLVSRRAVSDNISYNETGDIVTGLVEYVRAFNVYQRSLAEPWCVAARNGSGIRFTAIKPETELQLTIAGNDPSQLDVFINSIRKSSGVGQKRLFPSRLVRSYENFPEIIDNPFTASPTNSDSIIDLNPNDGQVITGAEKFFTESSSSSSQVDDTIIAFKNSSVFAVNVRTREFRQIASGGKGCTAPDSVVATPTGIMFANDHGIYKVTRSLEVQYVGEDLEELWKTVNKDALDQAVGILDPHDRLYKLAVPTGDSTTNDSMICYDYTREGRNQLYGSWFVYLISGITSMIASSKDLFMGTSEGDLWQVRRDEDSDGGDYQDAAGEAIPVNLTYGSQDFGDAGMRKKVRRVMAEFDMIDSDLTNVLLETSINSQDLWRSSGTASISRKNTSSYAQEQSPSIGWTPEARTCQRIKTRITHSQRKEVMVLCGLFFSVTGLSDRGLRENSDSEPS